MQRAQQRPTLYLLCGKVGAGKSTYAKNLSKTGVHRFSMDERALTKLKDLRDPNDNFRVEEKALRSAEREAKAWIVTQSETLLKRGESVVIDDGFWSKAERALYRELAQRCGASCELIYLSIDEETQWKRLQLRNQGDLTYVHFISKDDMTYLNALFEEPRGEGENVVIQTTQEAPAAE